MRSPVFKFLAVVGVLLLLAMPAAAQSQKTFRLGGNDVVLQDVSPTVEVYFQSMRLNRALNQWNLEIKLRNTAVRPLTGPVVVLFESVTNATGPLSPDGRDGSGKPWFDLSSRLPALGLDAGQSSLTRTLALGVTTGSPLLGVRVYAPVPAAGPALALANVVDLVGHPVGGVQISETGPEGSGTVDADPLLGLATLGRGEGTNLFRFSAPGYLPVWRRTSLANGSVRSLPTPRLPLRETNVFPIGPTGGGFSNRVGTVRVTVPANAFAAEGQAQLTALTPQTLPGLLPLGWSPLQAFWLDLSQEPVSPLSVRLDLLDVIKSGETAALVRWNATSVEWDVVQLVPGLGASAIVLPLPGSGAWALVVPDTGATTPPAAVVAQVLPASPMTAPDYAALSGKGSVEPSSSPASMSPALVTAQARLMVSNSAGALASGTLLRGEMTERYNLRDGTTRVIPPYPTYLVGYQRPGDADGRTLHAAFPMQPQLLLTPEELLLGSVFMDVLQPTSFAGGVLNTNGVSVTNGFLSVAIGAGTVGRVQAVQIDPLDGTNYSGFLPEGFTVAGAFRLVVGGLNGQSVALQVEGLSTNSLYVLARLRAENGAYGLEPIERLKTDGFGRLSSREPASPPRLPGITGSGQFVLVKVPAAQVLLSGIARNAAGQAVAGLLVKRDPWMTLSGAGGAFQLVSPAGAAQLLVTDLAAGDIGVLPVTVPVGGPLTGLAATAVSEGPRVLLVTPAAGSTNVPLVSAVEVLFSRPLNIASVLGNVRLASTLTSSVPASVTLNLRGNSITILPENPLAGGTVHTVVLSTNLADLSAQKLVGTNQFSFTTTQPEFIRLPGSQLVSYEPTNGFVKMEGTQGLVEPGKPVVLVNETTGRTSTTLANVDGSFRGDIQAEVDDKLSITLVNANGTRNSIPVSRQIFADGSVALFESGGAIETPGENGPIRFDIEPGAINGKTKFKFQAVPLTNVLTLVSNVAIEGGGRLLGGVKVSPIVGAQLSQSMDVSFPVKVSDMQLPNGVSPSNCSFGLVISRIVDGEQVFELVDRMHYEDGKVVTHSPPFFGLLGPFEDILVMPLLMAVSQTMTTIHGYTFAADVDPATGLPNAPLNTPRESLPGYQVLPGSIVSAKPFQSGVQPRGRLLPGAVYTISGANGSYALLVKLTGNSSDRAVSVAATHPTFPGVKAESYFPQVDPGVLLGIGNVLTPQNIVFPKAAVNAKTPPAMSVTQSPADAQIASNTVVNVLVTDNDSLPSLNYYIDSLFALDGSALPQSAITISDQTDAAVGSLARRYSFTVRSPKSSVVTFRLRAADAHGNVAERPLSIGFGLVPPPATNAIPVADPNDNVGPSVVLTDPPAESRGHAIGAPVVVQFDEAVDRVVEGDPVAVTVVPAAGTPRLTLSDDQTRLLVDLPLLRPDTEYSLTLGTTIRDIKGNRLTGPLRTNAEPYSFTFRTAPLALGQFPILSTELGVGVQILGNRAFLLKRVGTARGKLEAYSLSNPLQPTKIAEVSVPEFPRDMLVIPKYSFWWENPADSNPVTNHTQVTGIRTNDLLVAVGGLTGQGTFQWIRVYDITSPENWIAIDPFLAGAAVGFDGLSVPSTLKWSAPSLSYLETSTPDRISALDLQSWLIGNLMQRSQAGFMSLPFDGTNGVDLNFDGDYTDAGERPPLPQRGRILDFLGKEIAVGAFDTTAQIFDHVLENGGAYIGAVLGSGSVIVTNGLPSTNRLAASYRTLFSAGLTLDPTNSSYFYPEGYFPRRAASLFSFPLVLSNRAERLDLVAVTVRGPGTNFVSVLDVTDRLAVRQIDAVPVQWEGNNTNIFGIRLRDDGLLAVANMTNVVLIDPAKFGSTWTNGVHPALIGVLPGIGGSGRTFDSKPDGLGASPEVGDYGTPPRGVPVISMGPPTMDVVNLVGVEPFMPSTLAAGPATNAVAKLDRAFVVDFVAPGRFRGDDSLAAAGITNLSTVSNLAPRVHHYVRVRAPGGAGQFIDLAAEALNEAGEPLRKRGFLFPPVHGFTATTLVKLEQTPGADDAPVRSLRAWRASNDPNSPLFNVYLSRPFVVLNEELSVAELVSIRSQLDRDVFWGGHSLRFSLDPGAPSNSVTAPFTGEVRSSDRRHRPGVAVTVGTFPGDYLQSPNPGPVAGAATLPLVANALNAHNGELTINATDMVLPGRRMPLEFRRNYSGQGLFDGPFGRGWDFNFNQRVVPVPGRALGEGEKLPFVIRDTATNSETAGTNDLVFYNGAGRVVVFRHAGATAPAEIAADPLVQQLNWIPKVAAFYLPPDGLFTPMFRFKDGRYVRLDVDGKQTWFHPNGRLARIYDRYEKNFIGLVYNKRGDLTRIYDDVGRPLDIGYYRLGADAEFRAGVDETLPATGATTRWAALGRIARLKDYSGRDVLFFYSANGLLERREHVDVQTAIPGSFTGRSKTIYDYSDSSDPTRSGLSLVAVRGEEAGGASVAAVNGFTPRGRDTVGSLLIGGVETKISQTHNNTSKAMAAGNGSVKVTSPGSAVADLKFDSFGRSTQTIMTGPAGAPETNRTVFYTNGLVAAIIRPMGGRTEFHYDTNNPSLRSRGNLVLVRKIPDVRGGPVLEARSNFDERYNLTEGENFDYRGTRSVVTLFPGAKDIQFVSKEGETESFSVNEFGQVEQHKSVDNVVTETLFNGDGFPQFHRVGPNQSIFSYAPVGGAASDPGRRGKPSSVQDPESIPTEFLHDELDRLVTEKRAGAEASSAFDAAGNQILKMVRVETNRVIVERSYFGRLGFLTSNVIEAVEADGSTINLVTSYEPDEQNRVKKARFPGGEEQGFEYDHAGRLIRFTRGDVLTNSFEYDANGNLTVARVGDSEERYLYDGHDRMIGTILANGSREELVLDNNGSVVTNSTYDAANTLLARSIRELDGLNRVRRVARVRDVGESVVRTEFNSAAREVVTIDAVNAQATTTFDDAGRPWTVQTPNFQQRLTYDQNGNLKKSETFEGADIFSEQRDYNARNQLVRIEDNLGRENRLSVEVDGRVLASTDKLGRATTNSFTLLGEILATMRPNGVRVSQVFDADRHTTRISDALGSSSVFDFDEHGRLLNASLPNGASSSSGDFNEFFRARTNGLPRGIAVRAAYDRDGNVTNRVYSGFGPDRTEKFTFDGLRRYQKIEDDQGSVTFHYDLAGWVKKLDYAYRFGAFPNAAADLDFSVTQDTYLNEFRKELGYPADALKLSYDRDTTGRLLALTPSIGQPVVKSTAWKGETRVENRVLGPDVLRMEQSFDGMRRTIGRRYVRMSDGSVVADVRHFLDANGAILARQEVHRGARTDLFGYDAGYRLTRWDAGTRPGTTDGLPRALEGFSPASELPGSWAAGGFAKEFAYDATDRFTSNRVINPEALSRIAPAVTNLSGVDALLFVTNINGFARSRDEIGNVTRTLLAVRIPGQAAPVLVAASLAYDHLGRLTRVTRDDGVVVSHEYGPLNLRIRRTVTGPAGLCIPSDIAFFYDGANLIEERDLANGARLVRRYFYGDDGDELLAVDLDVAGTLRRHWYLVDNVRSVVALADATGAAVERVRYDAWGQPQIELADASSPAVSFVRLETNGVTVAFTEPVLALPNVPANGGVLVTATAGLNNLIEVSVGGSPVIGQVKFDETRTASGFGSVVRFTTATAIAGPVTIRVNAGGVRDEWGNTNVAYVTNLTVASAPGSVIATNAPVFSTAAALVGRSSAGSPMLFHGQYFDDETGLVYLRARFYDPFTATFLQRDPAGYQDSVNHYAGFANNPVNLRDPSGAATDEAGKQLVEIGSQASIKEDGVTGYLVGKAIVAVGNVLQLGTKTAEGLELLDSKAQGTFGLMDALKGADLIIEDANTAKAGFDHLNKFAALGAAAASRVHGMATGVRARAQAGNTAMRNKLRAEGLADFEIEGFVNAMHRFKKEMKAKSVEVGIRSFGEKAGARRERVEAGTPQKGSSIKDKTDATATVSKTIHSQNGPTAKKSFVSDTDLYYVKADGRTISVQEASRFQVIVGQEQAKAFRRAGKEGIPNVGVLHGPHVNMPELVGTGRLKKDIHGNPYGSLSDWDAIANPDPKKAAGGPGAEAFSIRLGSDGNVTAFNPSKQRLRGIVMESLQKFRASPISVVYGLDDLGPHWFRGFDNELPAAPDRSRLLNR